MPKDELLSFILGARKSDHRVLKAEGRCKTTQHTLQFFNFGVIRNDIRRAACEPLLRKMPRDELARVKVVAAPGYNGRVMGKIVAELLEVPFVPLGSKNWGYEPLYTGKPDYKDTLMQLSGKSCLIVDTCIETGAAAVSCEQMLMSFHAEVCGLLVFLDIRSRVDDEPIHRFPLSFPVHSYGTAVVEYWSPEQCPECTRPKFEPPLPARSDQPASDWRLSWQVQKEAR